MDIDTILLDTEERMEKAPGRPGTRLPETAHRPCHHRPGGRHQGRLLRHPPPPSPRWLPVAVPDSRTITIQPWDKGGISVVEKAILKSDLGLTSVNDGRIIRINIPPLTEERRKELVKVARSTPKTPRWPCATCAVMPTTPLKKLEKEKAITEDEQKKAEAEVQKLTDKFVADADKRSQAKEKGNHGHLASAFRERPCRSRTFLQPGRPQGHRAVFFSARRRFSGPAVPGSERYHERHAYPSSRTSGHHHGRQRPLGPGPRSAARGGGTAPGPRPCAPS